MNKLLVKFSTNWSDEFDVDGFALYSKEEWNNIVKKFKEAEEYQGCYFGTNKGWSKEEINPDWLNNYSSIEITDSEFTIIKKIFGEGYGIFISPLNVIEL